MNKPLVDVLAGKRHTPPPVWLMRQAGRYLPEYRAVRAKAGDFLDLVFNPELAAEVTLQPVRRFGFDAAILFSDILVVPHALGQPVRFAAGEGPLLDPIQDRNGFERILGRLDHSVLAPVYETVRLVKDRLDPKVALLGFCGAPWTVATYMIAGRGTPDQAPARLFGHRDHVGMDTLIDVLVEASIAYLVRQLQAGADAVQIFDTWAGVLASASFRRWCIAPTRRITDAVRHAVPGAKIIGFPRGAGTMLKDYADGAGVDAVGLDWMIDPSFAREHVQARLPVQGNLDPLALVAGGAVLDRSVDAVLEAFSGGPFIFNLGHGIVPETPVEHVERMLARAPIHGRIVTAEARTRLLRAMASVAITAAIVAALVWWRPAGLYPWFKALHVIAVIAWMAGMLYLPRLFVYHCAAPPGSPQSETFKVMERRLLRIIINPAMVATWALGLWLAYDGTLFGAGWLHAKLVLVLLMSGVHGFLAGCVRDFAHDRNRRTEKFYRVINEVPTLLMIAIVILAVVKPF